jgi:hypothetical protein
VETKRITRAPHPKREGHKSISLCFRAVRVGCAWFPIFILRLTLNINKYERLVDKSPSSLVLGADIAYNETVSRFLA